MEDFKKIWNDWCESWTITNNTEREQELQKFIAEDFKYTDPLQAVNGRAQISDYIGQFQEQFPGTTFVPTKILSHHDRYLIKWDMLNEKNEVVDDGTSFALVEDNRLKDITGFFDVENYPNL
ncbi:nuclear transport factor 2 family protein [Maribacter luteus]|uniref:SnoaL-like domain-containing protein n=1 Tax=Maribacter luteus TaxID=2594478 RepID=A0A6I2MM24_9FLAO|nr:nuclear transport factor 2 family protein [Maribacter luteus]MRX63689.1 hypothetical protein [Maribacter luteus]|tara:strand:- start:2058 stop:2423 length:366 start_codon:yes stop_codon:yes gene_type:complete